MGIPESREARYSVRGKPQTSYWRALKVAQDTLVVSHVEPRRIDPTKGGLKRREEILGRNWKPKVPMIYAELDWLPFKSRDQFLETLETDYKPETKKTKVAPKSNKREEREQAKAALLALFD